MILWKRQECTDGQIVAFWQWFAQNEEKVTQKEGVHKAKALREMEEHLQIMFPGCRGDVDMTITPIGDFWEIEVMHGGRPYVKKTAQRIRVLMPAELQGKWRMEISE